MFGGHKFKPENAGNGGIFEGKYVVQLLFANRVGDAIMSV
jgi:hypothetical protein